MFCRYIGKIVESSRGMERRQTFVQYPNFVYSSVKCVHVPYICGVATVRRTVVNGAVAASGFSRVLTHNRILVPSETHLRSQRYFFYSVHCRTSRLIFDRDVGGTEQAGHLGLRDERPFFF